MASPSQIPPGWTIQRSANGTVSVAPPPSVSPGLSIHEHGAEGDAQRVLLALCEALLAHAPQTVESLASADSPSLVTRWGVHIEVEGRTVLSVSPHHVSRDSTFGAEVERDVIDMAVRRLAHIVAHSPPASADTNTHFGSTLSEAGFRAFYQGVALSSCPFECESPASVLWESGWLDAFIHSRRGHGAATESCLESVPSPSSIGQSVFHQQQAPRS